MKSITLKPRKEQPVLRFHPWIFSGAIQTEEPDIQDGEPVQVQSSSGDFLGLGHYQTGSIRVRLFSFEKVDPSPTLWRKKLQDAWDYRQVLGLPRDKKTDCFRWVHAEGDGLPGLIIDLYGKTAVMQCHSLGMYRIREQLAQAMLEVPGAALEAIYCKSRNALPERFARETEDHYLFGQATPVDPVVEHGLRFRVDWEGGQKTGFFLDQRDNRQLLERYASGARVLNCFAYSGGFSVYALRGGARRVDSVDISRPAVALAEENVRLNFPESDSRHRAVAADALQFLRQANTSYDLIVVDPPAFAKSRSKRHRAVLAYKRLNQLAMEKLAPGGILFTFSCSQVVDEQLFYDTIAAAAFGCGKQARVMHRLGQPADHPVSIAHSEGKYLKGLVLRLH